MSIRYTKDYIKEIRRIVHNYNTNRNRAIKRGLKNVPPIAKVSDLKARYTTRKELNRELAKLSKFKGDALKQVENRGGATAIKWELDYLKQLTNSAKRYYDREIESTRRYLAKFKTQRDIGKEEHLNELLDKRAFLDLELSHLNQIEYKTYRATIYEYTQAHTRDLRSYRGFLSELEGVMSMTGYSDETIKTFMEKFKVLSPEEFVYLYNNSDLVARVYELADSPTYGPMKLNTSEANARDFIDTLLEEQDDLIKNAQEEFKTLNEDMKV